MSGRSGTIFDSATRPEWRLLGLAATGTQDERDDAVFKELLGASSVNWGELFDLAVRHKMVCMLADQIALLQAWPLVPSMIAEHLRDQLRFSRHRLSVYRTAAAEIAAQLRSASISAACTKGIVLESDLYGGRGGRYLGDIDFMIDVENGTAVAAVMQTLGFSNGYIHRSTGEVQLHTRRDLIAYRLNPDHLPTFIKSISDRIIPYVQVDFACSFTWARSEYRVPVSTALERIRHITLPATPGASIPSLDVDYLFLFTLLHLFREAWLSTWTTLGQDVNLAKFADVVRSWKRWRQPLKELGFKDLATWAGVLEPVSWVLEHADRTFGTDIRADLEIGTDLSEDFLSSAGPTAEGESRRFGSMLERLFPQVVMRT